MAGNVLYIGQLFNAMIDKLTVNITEMQNLRTAIMGSVKSLNVVASDNLKQSTPHSELSILAQTNSYYYRQGKSGLVSADGTIRVKANAKYDSGGNGGLYVKVGSTYYYALGGSGSYVPVFIDVVVTVGATIEIGSWSRSIDKNGYVAANSIALNYDFKDLSVEGIASLV